MPGFHRRSRALLPVNLRIFSLGLPRRAGMIEPNMATMLVYLLTDLDVPRDVLRQMCAGYPIHIWPFPPAVATRCLSP